MRGETRALRAQYEAGLVVAIRDGLRAENELRRRPKRNAGVVGGLSTASGPAGTRLLTLFFSLLPPPLRSFLTQVQILCLS